MCSDNPNDFEEQLQGMDKYLLDLIFQKRNENEEESLLSRIAHAKIDSKHLSNDEAVKLTRQIFVAGNETTTSLISNLVWRLLSIDNFWKDFIEDKINMTNAYGRANKSVVRMLLAKLYLNAQVYTGVDRYTDALTYTKKVIDEGGYTLEPNFASNFTGDNNASSEIIYPLIADPLVSQSYGNTPQSSLESKK